MESVVTTLVPFLITAAMLAVLMFLTMGVGWVSGKLLKRLLGIGGK